MIRIHLLEMDSYLHVIWIWWHLSFPQRNFWDFSEVTIMIHSLDHMILLCYIIMSWYVPDLVSSLWIWVLIVFLEFHDFVGLDLNLACFYWWLLKETREIWVRLWDVMFFRIVCWDSFYLMRIWEEWMSYWWGFEKNERGAYTWLWMWNHYELGENIGIHYKILFRGFVR